MKMSAKHQFIRFSAVGAFGTALHYFILIMMVSTFFVDASIAAMVGAACGAASNYWLNHRFSFKSTRRHREAIPRFVVMALTSVMLNGAIVKLLTIGGVNYILAQIIATLTILALNFLLSQKWIFAKIK